MIGTQAIYEADRIKPLGFTVMIAMSPGDLIPGPQLLSVAFSITEAAVADTTAERRKALARLKEAILKLRESFDDIRRALKAAPQVARSEQASPLATEDIRRPLEMALSMEYSLGQLSGIFKRLLSRRSVRQEMSRPGTTLHYRDLVEFSGEIVNDYVRLIRECRLVCIEFIALRAQKAGLNVINVSDEFRSQFMAMPITETESWNETAWLLADLDYSGLLQRAIESTHQDRTDEIVAFE